MTDNRTTKLDTTELLCKLLEERGIEWKDGEAAYEIEWNTPDGRHCSAMYWKPTFTVLVSGCTPEQAIAATLGNCTLMDVMPSRQHEEIIRCRDCGFSHERELGDLRCHGPLTDPWDYYSDKPSDGVKIESSGYCAWGKWKDNK